jgi:hypothetical protein
VGKNGAQGGLTAAKLATTIVDIQEVESLVMFSGLPLPGLLWREKSGRP